MIPKRAMNGIAVTERFELYCLDHPRTPSAVRLPRLFMRSGMWVALLGASLKDGIAGFGSTVELALSAFDRQYLNTLRQPDEQIVVPTSRVAAVRNPARSSQPRAA
jgi:hypothetical protein